MGAAGTSRVVDVDALGRDGFWIAPDVLNDSEVSALIDALNAASESGGAISRRNSGGGYAMRNLLERVPAVRALAGSAAIARLLEPVLGPGAFVVRGLLFDKVAGANWHVGWHQDRAIAVQSRVEVDGFGPWSVKAGVVHVEPPVDVLERMLTLRIHLDDCGADNGPLRVMPGSHGGGRLDSPGVRRWLDGGGAVTCCVRRGGVLMMRPLVLHASSPAQQPGHRRVIHLEYASEPLPGGLAWRESAAASRPAASPATAPVPPRVSHQ